MSIARLIDEILRPGNIASSNGERFFKMLNEQKAYFNGSDVSTGVIFIDERLRVKVTGIPGNHEIDTLMAVARHIPGNDPELYVRGVSQSGSNQRMKIYFRFKWKKDDNTPPERFLEGEYFYDSHSADGQGTIVTPTPSD